MHHNQTGFRLEVFVFGIHTIMTSHTSAPQPVHYSNPYVTSQEYLSSGLTPIVPAQKYRAFTSIPEDHNQEHAGQYVPFSLEPGDFFPVQPQRYTRTRRLNLPSHNEKHYHEEITKVLHELFPSEMPGDPLARETYNIPNCIQMYIYARHKPLALDVRKKNVNSRK